MGGFKNIFWWIKRQCLDFSLHHFNLQSCAPTPITILLRWGACSKVFRGVSKSMKDHFWRCAVLFDVPPRPLSPGVASEGGKRRLLVAGDRINEARSLLGLMERCVCAGAHCTYAWCAVQRERGWRGVLQNNRSHFRLDSFPPEKDADPSSHN